MVRARTQTASRLQTVVAALIPIGLLRGLNADAAATALRTICPRTTLARIQRRVAVDLAAEIRLDKRIATTTEQITAVVTESRTILTELDGIGALLAGKILACTGTVERFRSAAAFSTHSAPGAH